MGTIRKMGSNWQCMVRIKDHPQLSKSFKTNADAKRWGIETELKIRREDAGIAKISYPTPNPVLSIRRPKKSEPRNRRLSDAELNLLIRGNHTDEVMR